MKITYHITADDYADAQRAHASSKTWRRWNRRISLAILITFLALAIVLTIFDPEKVAMGIPIIIVLSVFLVLVLLTRTNLLWRWQYRKIDVLKREFTSEITDDGIISSSDVGRSEMKWTLFMRWYEATNAFLLYTQPRLFHVFPKRAFSPGEMTEFRELLQRKILAK